jgi:hypothetical protein
MVDKHPHPFPMVFLEPQTLAEVAVAELVLAVQMLGLVELADLALLFFATQTTLQLLLVLVLPVLQQLLALMTLQQLPLVLAM